MKGDFKMPVRVLQVVTTLNCGGLETMLMNYYRNIDRTKVQFDFLVHRDVKGDYEEEAISLGANIYRVPPVNPFSPGYYKALDEFFAAHKYDIVHSHLDCMSAFVLAVAKKHGVKHRFAHAHSSSQDKDLKYVIKLFSKRLIPLFATELFACGEDSGRWMFGKNEFKLLNNAIDAKGCTYNPTTAKSVKDELGLGDSFVIGHVGRFCYPKNHSFLIDIFYALLQKVPDSRLLLIGKGELEEDIKCKVNDLKISDSVSFLGLRSDVSALLQGMDVFLFPSVYEGLSLATVEAQAAGLPCVLSQAIPHECKITENVDFVPLDASPEEWAEHILKYRTFQRENTFEAVRTAGFDIGENAKKLQEYYISKVNG